MSTKRKLSTKLGQPMVKPSAKPVTKQQVNDARAVVSGGGDAEDSEINGVQNVVEISSDSSSDSADVDSEDEEEDITQDSTVPIATPKPNVAEDEDEEMGDEGAEPQSQEDVPEDSEPAFGDLMLASAPIDVAAFSANGPSASNPKTLISATSNSLSLTTVLTQALRTNDISLLESCLQTPDATIIRATIERLSSPLASTLLSKLAERLHRRPGRSGSLMVWVQWTLVTHGGYLATQKDLIAQLRELNRVIEERAKSLNSLLSLKGKLDMLEAQMQLRRSMRSQREVDEDEVDENVIYVENSSSEDEAALSPESEPKSSKPAPKLNGTKRASSPSSSVSEDMPNGISAEGEIADEESDQDDVSDLLDDEAEETDADSEDENDEDEVDHDDMDEIDEDEESEEERVVPPKKIARMTGMFSKSSA